MPRKALNPGARSAPKPAGDTIRTEQPRPKARVDRPLRVISVGEPGIPPSLARLLWQIHVDLHLKPKNEKPRDAVPPKLQGQK